MFFCTSGQSRTITLALSLGFVLLIDSSAYPLYSLAEGTIPTKNQAVAMPLSISGEGKIPEGPDGHLHRPSSPAIKTYPVLEDPTILLQEPATGRVATQPIQARSTHGLTLTDALTLVEKANPQLLAARKSIDVSRAGIDIAREIPNPQIEGYHYWGSVVALGTNHQVGLTQQVETAGKRRKRTNIAKSQLGLSQEQYNTLLWDIRSQTRQAYIRLASAKESINLIDAQSELAHHLLHIAQKRVSAGAAPLSEQLQAELAHSQIDAQRIQAMTELRQASGQLNTLLGNPLTASDLTFLEPSALQPPSSSPSLKADANDGRMAYDIVDEGYFDGDGKTELVPLPSRPLPDFAALLEKAKKQRPDLLAALQQVKVNQDQLTLTKAQRVPDMFVSVGYPFLRVEDKYAPNRGQNYYSGFWAQLGFTVPVFHNQKAEIRQGNAVLEQSQLQVTAVQKQLLSDLYNAFQALEGSRNNINLYRQNLLPSSAEVLHLAQKSYQYGKTGLSSVIIAQQQIQQIRQGYIQSVLDYHKAWSDLEKTVGTRLDF